MAIILLLFLILLLAGLVFLGIVLAKWALRKKIRVQVVAILLVMGILGLVVNHFFFKNMRFIQSEVYPNLYLVKYPDKDYSMVEQAIQEKIREHLKTEHKTGKPLAYTDENGIYFYELGGRTFGFLGEAGTGYFIDHEEDLGGFVSEELGMYRYYLLAEFYYDSCPQHSTMYCGEINYFKEGEFFKVDSLTDLVSINFVEKNNTGDTILQLKRAFAAKNDSLFLGQFPSGFQQFMEYFGWDNQQGQPYPLYEESQAYIDYFFESIPKEKYRTFETKLIDIAKNGHWQEDGVNYFQDKTLEYIKLENRYTLINSLDPEEAKSVLFFLFDGPHPKYDADFASHLNPSKKRIFEELFETGFYDDNENPDPILPDPETPDPIDYEGSIHYAVSDFESNEHYFIRDIDINNDGVLDKIVCADAYQGDELLLFINKDGEYQFSLKTTNFSEDGGNQIVDVVAEQSGFVVETAFPDGGLLEAYHHIVFANKGWVLTNTVYKTQSSNQEDAFVYVCDVPQELDLGTIDVLDKLKWMPKESERERLCTKEMN